MVQSEFWFCKLPSVIIRASAFYLTFFVDFFIVICTALYLIFSVKSSILPGGNKSLFTRLLDSPRQAAF